MAKRNLLPLVFQHLESISRSALERYQKLIRAYVHDKSGIYALYQNGKLYYVGLASNLNSRLKQHLSDKHGDTWDSFSVYLTQGDEHLREIEALILRVSYPQGNVLPGNLKFSENLKDKFKKDIEDFHSSELDKIFLQRILRNASGETIKQHPQAQYKGIRMHFRYKDNLYVGYYRKDGTIRFSYKSHNFKKFRKKIYSSPSGAARAVTGRPIDGWHAWKYQLPSGEWVELDRLRRK